MIYYSSDSPSSLITELLSVTQSLLHTRRVSRITVKALVTSNIIQSVCLVGKGRLKERCGLEPRTDFLFRLRNRQKLVWIRFENIRHSSYLCLIQKLSFSLFVWRQQIPSKSQDISTQIHGVTSQRAVINFFVRFCR